MTIPFELEQVLRAGSPADRETAWADLVARHTRLFLAVARSFGGSRDEAMERYSYIIEKLYENDYRRLRAFQLDGGALFSTWLTVTARRLCLDHYRARYGRARPARDRQQADALRSLRRRLQDATAVAIEPDLLPDESSLSAESEAIRRERDERLQLVLEALPAGDRLLLRLRFEDDLSASRIASALGLPTPFHVYRRLNAVLTRLRAALQSGGIDGSAG